MAPEALAAHLAQRLEQLQEKVQQLEDQAALQALKTRYARAADAKYTLSGQRQTPQAFAAAARAQAACFTEDATWEGGDFGAGLRGREALYDSFVQAPWRYAMHFYQAAALQIAGDTASGTWLLWQICVREDNAQTLLLHGRTHEHYQRTAQGWLIAHMRFDSLHSIAIADAPDALRRLIPAAPQPFPNEDT